MRLIGFIFAWFAYANNASAIDLLRSYEMALASDPTYQSITQEYLAGLENVRIGRAAILPKVAGNYNNAVNRATQWGQQFPGGPNISYNWNYPSDFAALQLTQPLFNLDALARFKQGAAQTDLSQSKFMSGSQDLLIRVAQAYMDVLFSMDQLRFQEVERDAFLEQSKAAQRLFERGEGAQTNVLEAKAAYQFAESKVVDGENALEITRRKLDAIVGGKFEHTQTIARLKKQFEFLTMVTNDFTSWKERALASNPELKSMQNQIAIALQEYQKLNAGHYPVLNLVAALTTQSSNTVSSINQTTNQNYLGLQLSLPIFSGGETISRSAQAYANYQKAKADYDVARDRILTEMRQQFDLVRSGPIKIRALQSAKDYSSTLVDSMRKGVISGEKINLDVLVAQKSLLMSSRDLAQSQYLYLIAYLRLNQLGGGLEVDDFKKVAAYFIK
jgi:protease secretion system outer membrane protein